MWLVSIIALAVIGFASTAMAIITVEFDPSTGVDVTGYYMYVSYLGDDGTMKLMKTDLGNNTQWRAAANLWKPKVHYSIFATAYTATGSESMSSNVLRLVYDGEPEIVKMPPRPKEIKILFQE